MQQQQHLSPNNNMPLSSAPPKMNLIKNRGQQQFSNPLNYFKQNVGGNDYYFQNQNYFCDGAQQQIQQNQPRFFLLIFLFNFIYGWGLSFTVFEQFFYKLPRVTSYRAQFYRFKFGIFSKMSLVEKKIFLENKICQQVCPKKSAKNLRTTYIFKETTIF